MKLTQSDKKKIANYEASIIELESDICQINKHINKKISAGMYDYLAEKIDMLQFQIKKLRQMIRDIKVNRFNIQKSRLS